MKIGIDARLLLQTGVGVYIRNLLTELKELKTANESMFYVYIRPEDEAKVPSLPENFVLRHAPFQWHSVSEQTSFLQLLNKDQLDLMHFTYFSFPILYKKPYVITIHDTIPFTHATGKASTKNALVYTIKKAGYSLTLKSALKNARVILTPTGSVKNELQRIFPHSKVPIEVTYEGVQKELFEHTKTSSGKIQLHNKIVLERDSYFLYVGNFYPHKNVEKLIHAFSKVNTDKKLLLVGPDDFFSNKIKQLISNTNNERILLNHNVPLNLLARLYENAYAFVHPSLIEGFGLPLLEATFFGCPIVASDIPVFHEILNHEYASFNPQDINSMTHALQKTLETPLTRPKLHLIDPRFSFKTMARNTFEIYQRVLKL